MRPLRGARWLWGLSVWLLMALPALAAPRWAQLDLTGIDGRDFDTSRLDGKVVLVVNVASFCSYSSQYSDLQRLWNRYQERGFVVLGVPCNQFGGQEPGTGKEIKNYCKTRFGVDFPLLAKQDVNGPDRSPLFQWLVAAADPPRDVSWNFEKFLVNRAGDVVARFGSHVSPTEPALVRTIEMALDNAL